MFLFAVRADNTEILKELKKLEGQLVLKQNQQKKKLNAQLVPKQNQRKVKVSKMNSVEWALIKADGNLKCVAYQQQHMDTYQPQRPWKSFEWDDSRTERQQSSDYLRHLREYIDVMSTQHGFVDVAADDGFLSFLMLGREYVGTTNVAIAAQSSASIDPANGLRVVMELKKRVNIAKHYQAMVYVLLAGVKYPEYHPVSLLTNLGKTWFIIWLDGIQFGIIFSTVETIQWVIWSIICKLLLIYWRTRTWRLCHLVLIVFGVQIDKTYFQLLRRSNHQ